MQNQNINITDLSLAFSLKLIDYFESLNDDKKYLLGKQLLRAGISVGANVHEARNTAYKPDFICKINLAAKEAEEAKYWLILFNRSRHYPDCSDLLNDCIIISKLLNKIVSASKLNRKN